MTQPSIELDLGKLRHNTEALVDLLDRSGISLTGVTKAVLGLPSVARALIEAGAVGLADSRVENVERMRTAGITASCLLLRSPMPSQVDRIVRAVDVSCNTEVTVLRALSAAAADAATTHGVLLMVELGDLREGIQPCDLHRTAEVLLGLPNLRFTGIGTNLACRSGVAPDERNMQELSHLADSVEEAFGLSLDVVSGGNSANLAWLLTEPDVGRVNDLRLGEAILLGREPLHRQPVPGLHLDAVTVSAEVIESQRKPTKPTGVVAETAFGSADLTRDRGEIWQTIVALGHQDTDPAGLVPPAGITVLGASSDHLVLETPCRITPGSKVCFLPGYGALVRAMTSPFVSQTVGSTRRGGPPPHDPPKPPTA